MPHACGETMYKFDLGASGLWWGGPCTVLRGEASCPGASPTCSRLLLPRQRPVHGVGEGGGQEGRSLCPRVSMAVWCLPSPGRGRLPPPTPHPQPLRTTQERPPLAPEFGSMALGTPRKPTLALPSSGAPALPRTLAAEWPQGARLPAERAHERIPNLQPPTGSAFCPVHAPS